MGFAVGPNLTIPEVGASIHNDSFQKINSSKQIDLIGCHGDSMLNLRAMLSKYLAVL